MRGGTAIHCPACAHRQVVGSPGAQLKLPMHVACAQCGAALVLEKSQSGGAHVIVESAAAS